MIKDKYSKFKQIIKKVNISNIFIIIAVIALMIIWWNIRLQDKPPREELILESGEPMTFIAEFDQIHGMAFSCDDVSAPYYPEENIVAIKLQIIDKQGDAIWRQNFEDVVITPFEITELKGLENMPIMLEKGQEYCFSYESDQVAANTLTIALYGLEKEILPQYLVVCGLIIVTLIMAMCLGNKKITKCHKVILTIGIYLLLGVLYNIVLIPFSVQDEPTHFAQAYAISSKWLGKDAVNPNGYVYMYQSGLIRLNWCGDAQTDYRFWNDWNYGDSEVQSISTMYTNATELQKYVYCVPAIGITVARILHAPYQIVLIAGRLANLLFFVAVALLALKINPDMKRCMSAIFLFPSVVWLSGSYSYDTWNLGFSALLFSYCMYCRNRKKYVSWKDIAVIIGICIIFVPVKFIYFVMSFCVLFISKEKFRKKAEQIIAYTSVVGGAVATAFIARGASALSYATTENVDVRSIVAGSEERERFTVGWILDSPSHIIHTIKVYINTLFEQGENYIYKSINGSFLSVEVPKLIIFAFLFVVLIIMADETRKMKVRVQDRVIAFGIFGVGCGLVLTTFLFVYSFVHIYSIGTIAGVQGRYFLPFLLLLPLMLQGQYIIIDEDKKDKALFLLLGLNLLVLMCNFSAILRG